MNIRLVDVHTHVNFNAFKEDGDEVIRRAHGAGVGMILVGSQIDTSRRAVEYAKKYPEGVYAAVGLHPIHLEEGHFDVAEEEAKAGVPNFATRREKFDYEAYKALAGNPKTVAIGECGLDYYRITHPADAQAMAGKHEAWNMEQVKKRQEETFRQQVNLAREVKKPLMLHCRNAYEDMLGVLKDERAEGIGGDVHFFAGDWAVAKQFLDLGFYLSFTGVITFTREYNEVIKNAPLDRIMAETDAPYVTP
ncbi:MAG: TatD family hydrolase, partial [Patescibacteria group bacterium]